MWRVVNFLVGIGWHKVLCTFDPEIFKGRFGVELDKERWFAHQAAWRAYVIARLHFVADKDLFRYDEQIKEGQFFYGYYLQMQRIFTRKQQVADISNSRNAAIQIMQYFSVFFPTPNFATMFTTSTSFV